MLTDAQVERWSRQLILPEVGARGQLRLLRARVLIAGDGSAARWAGRLVERAGVGTATGMDDADVLVAVGADADRESLGREATMRRRPLVIATQSGEAARIALLIDRPCVACLPPSALHAGAGDDTTLAAPLALALGAVVAGEVLQALLPAPPASRLHTVDLATGGLQAIVLDATGCARCGRAG